MSTLTTYFYRGQLIESVHSIKCFIGSINGETIYSTKNENDFIYPRSAIKIFQAIPFVRSKAIKFHNLNSKQIALSCSSHCAEKFHVKELNDWLIKTKLKKTHLKCGIHSPLDKIASQKLYLSGSKPNQIHNNCSGKHLAMLSSCKINNYDLSNYVDLNHPHQEEIRKIFSEFVESKIFKTQHGVDGCSAPQYSFKIKDLGTALKNLLNSLDDKFNYRTEVSLLINSILKNPNYIGGTKNLDSNLMKIAKGDIFCKGGAEGVFLFAHIKLGIFGVFKVMDGNERALPSAILALFKKFNILSREQQTEYLTYFDSNLYNHAKIRVGKIRTELS